MNAGKLRWGILGPGRIARQFAADIAHVDHATIAAVASRDGGRAARFAEEYGIPRHHEGYERLFADDGVDAVYVATPHSYHLEHCTAALTAGKAVLCEKPLVTSPQDCRQLMARQREADAYLMEGMWTWFLPAVRKALEWYRAGRIGELLHVKAEFGYPLDYSAGLREYDASVGGGAVLEMGIYPVAIARWFTGAAPRNLVVRGRRAANGVEDDVTVLASYGDCLASLGTSFRCKLPNVCWLIGDQGRIALPDFWRASSCMLFEVEDEVDRFMDGRNTFGFDYEIAEVSAEIIAGYKESATVPLATSLALQEDMQAIRAAVP